MASLTFWVLLICLDNRDKWKLHDVSHLVFFFSFFCLSIKNKLLRKHSHQGHLITYTHPLTNTHTPKWCGTYEWDLKHFSWYNPGSPGNVTLNQRIPNPMLLTAQEASGHSPMKTQTDQRGLSQSKALPSSCWSELSRDNGLSPPEGVSSANTWV